MNNFLSVKRLIRSSAILIAGCSLWYAHWKGYFDPAALLSLAGAHPVATPVVFAAVFAGSMAALLPTAPLNVAAGVFWGPWLGSLVAIAGSWTGSIMAFWLSRAAFGQPFARRFDRKFINWAQQELDHHGWKVVAFVRLNPLFPGPINHVLGLTSIRFGTFSWATLVFATPPTVAFAVLGHVAGNLLVHPAVGNSKLRLLLFGLAALALALLPLARWANLGPARPVLPSTNIAADNDASNG